jgi:flagellar biosynthesis anti-sigma factor FlgM
VKIENRGDSTNINPCLNRVQDAAERPESKQSAPAHDAPADRVELSQAAKALQQTRTLLAASPEIRPEKVAELKGMIQRGVYNVKGREVAAKMIGQGLFDHLV